MARKFIIRQNLSKMSNNLEKRDSLTTRESKSINNFGTLTNFALAWLKKVSDFINLKVSLQVFFKCGICAMATMRHLPRGQLCPTDYWANKATFWTQDSQEESCTMAILSLSPMVSKQNFPGHLLVPIKTNISLSIFDQTRQHTKSKNWPQHSLQAPLHKPNTTLAKSKQVFGNSLRHRVVPKFHSYFQGWSLQDWLKLHCEHGETCQSN